MVGINYKELSNLIREKCKIRVTDLNRDKFVFSKEEQLIILTHLTAQEESIKRRREDSEFIKDVVDTTLQSLVDKGVIDASE